MSDFADVGYRGATASAAAIGPGWPPAFADIDAGILELEDHPAGTLWRGELKLQLLSALPCP